jgi:hypothetical protein
MSVKMLCFTHVLRRKNNVTFDERDHSQRVIQGYGIQHKKTQIEQPRNSLEAYKLEYSYYNMTEHGSMSLQLDFETSTRTHDTIVAWHEDVPSSQLL